MTDARTLDGPVGLVGAGYIGHDTLRDISNALYPELATDSASPQPA